ARKGRVGHPQDTLRKQPARSVLRAVTYERVAVFYTILYGGCIEGCNMAQTLANKPVSINIRAKARQRDLIDQPAGTLGRTRSDFMLEAACRSAENVLLDQAYFSVDSTVFSKFQKLLDHPLPPTDRLRRLMRAKAPWDK